MNITTFSEDKNWDIEKLFVLSKKILFIKAGKKNIMMVVSASNRRNNIMEEK